MQRLIDHKVLVLIDDLFYQYGLDGKEHDGVLFLPMLNGNISKGKKVLRGIRKVWLSSRLPLKEAWLGNWLEKIKPYDTIILGDAGNTRNVVNYIYKKYPGKRIIVWYRNSVSKTVPVYDFNRECCELWSFDKKDCEKYGMQYNPQFYIKNLNYVEKDKTIDAFFIGQDKGRKELLDEMKSTLEDHGLKCEFDIVGVNSGPLSYSRVLDKISHSRAIVDCQGQWQNGITLRPMEALFYEKKLITNSKEINKADYYCKENIFIWGRDDISKLSSFMSYPIVRISDDIKCKYGISGWISNFFNSDYGIKT